MSVPEQTLVDITTMLEYMQEVSLPDWVEFEGPDPEKRVSSDQRCQVLALGQPVAGAVTRDDSPLLMVSWPVRS
jgi:hypothetical protein